jgi:MFS family permease
MLSILKNRTFLLLFLGNTISLIGFGFNLVGVSWLVLEVTGSELALGKLMAMATVPGVVLALFAGIIIDKVNRKWLLVVLDLFRMVVVGTFVILLIQDRFSMTALFITVLLMGTGSSLFWPTAQAFVQELVSAKDYFHANALLSASYQAGSILGAGIGGVVIHFYGVPTALAFNALTHLISALLISAAPFRRQVVHHEVESIWQSVSKGFIYFKEKVGVLILGFTTILADVAIWGALSVLTITISKEVFLAGSLGYGLMEGFYGVGALISTVAVGYMTRFLGRGCALLLCYVVAGVMCLLAPIAISIYLAGVAYFFMGLHNNAARICIRTIFMEQIPNNIMGRVQTILGVYTRLLVVSSALSAGWITENLSVDTGMIFTGIHYLVALLGTITILAVPAYNRIIKQEAV